MSWKLVSNIIWSGLIPALVAMIVLGWYIRKREKGKELRKNDF